MKNCFILILISGLSVFSSCKKKDVEGCTDFNSTNYNPDATIDDGSCAYEIDRYVGTWALTDTTIDQQTNDTLILNRNLIITRTAWNKIKISTLGGQSCLVDIIATGSGNTLTIAGQDNEDYFCNNLATVSGSGQLNGNQLRLFYYFDWFQPNLHDLNCRGTAIKQ